MLVLAQSHSPFSQMHRILRVPWLCIPLMVGQHCRETEDRQECGIRDQPTADEHGDVISYHLAMGVAVTDASSRHLSSHKNISGNGSRLDDHNYFNSLWLLSITGSFRLFKVSFEDNVCSLRWQVRKEMVSCQPFLRGR